MATLVTPAAVFTTCPVSGHVTLTNAMTPNAMELLIVGQ